MKNWRLIVCLIGLVISGVVSCTIHDAPRSKRQYVTVYTSTVGEYDEELFQRFKKETGIEVRVRKFDHGQLIHLLDSERYNCKADLLLLSSYDEIRHTASKGYFSIQQSELLSANIDPNYRSRSGQWYALSKTPVVMVYHREVLKRDTIQNYYELNHPRWTGKLAFQNPESATLTTFRQTIRQVLKDRSDEFLSNLGKQAVLPSTGDDVLQLKRILRGEAQLALVRLSVLAKEQTHPDANEAMKKLAVKFPNQRKKGCYIHITGAGVYRYASNPANALKLLEYLASARGQYAYAAGRMEFSVMDMINSREVLQSYGKFRARFYRIRKSKRS